MHGLWLKDSASTAVQNPAMAVEPVTCTPPDDNLLVRSGRGVGQWTMDKLDIVSAYLPAFATACSRRSPGWYYVDAFAGPGVNVLPDGQRVCGSPLIALEAVPAFTTCLLMDNDQKAINALLLRTMRFYKRAQVRRGNVNRDLIPFMAEYVPRRAPCVCVLDPEGFEVEWSTIEALATFGEGRLTELLVLFQADGLHRILGLRDQHEWPGDLATAFFGNSAWEPIAARKRRGELRVDEARTEFLHLYRSGLEELGYRTDSRDIQEWSTEGRLKYILVFASGNETGLKIMKECFDKRYTGAQLQLFRPPRRQR